MKTFLTRPFTDAGLLVARAGVGAMFILHGWPKLIGGPEKWGQLGGAMGNLGVDFAPVFWGLMAALAEFGGGALLIAGLFHRAAAAMMAFTMLVAVVMHATAGDPFIPKVSYPLELCIVFVALFLAGPGRFSLDRKFIGGAGER